MARTDRESLQTPQPSVLQDLERRDGRRDRFAGPSPALAGMLGKSSAMRHVFAVINRVAKASTADALPPG